MYDHPTYGEILAGANIAEARAKADRRHRLEEEAASQMAATYDTRRSCQHCAFWFRKMPAPYADLGDCRRMPPTLLPVTMAGQTENRHLRTFWPSTSKDQWCGEFERGKEAPKSP